MSYLDTASSVVAVGVAGYVGWVMWGCYKREGSISPSTLAKCFIKGAGNTAADVAKEVVAADDKRSSAHRVKGPPSKKLAVGGFEYQAHQVASAIGIIHKKGKLNKKLKKAWKSLFH